MRAIAATGAGALFGLGLVISGMTDTRKVQGWLDITGAWDPTLAFVLGGAILPMFVAWRLAASRREAILGGPLPAPAKTELSTQLAAGSVLFGIGWGLSGLCPGPAMASLSFGGWQGAAFFIAMCVAMIAQPRVTRAFSSAR